MIWTRSIAERTLSEKAVREIVAKEGEWFDMDRECLDLIDLLEDCTADRNSTYSRDEADRPFGNSAVGWDVNLQLDSGLNNGNYSDFEVNQTDFAGDCVARQNQFGLERRCSRLRIRSPRAYRRNIPPPSIALLSIAV